MRKSTTPTLFGPKQQTNVVLRLRAIARHFAARTAIKEFNAHDECTQINYSELESYSTNFAAYLHKKYQIKKGDRVGVALETSIESVVTLLALWKLGAVFVPLESNQQHAARAKEKIEAAELTFVIGSDTSRHLERSDVFIYVPDLPTLAFEPNYGFQMSEIALTDPAYVEFTSGSTGKPKVVVVPHGGPATLWEAQTNLLHDRAFYPPGAQHPQYRDPLTQHDTVLLLAPPSFDATFEELFKALQGNTAIIPDPCRARTTPGYLDNLILREQVTVATFLANHLANLDPDRLSSMQDLISMGAAPKPDSLLRLLLLLRGTIVRNEWGVTEGGTARDTTNPLAEFDVISAIAEITQQDESTIRLQLNDFATNKISVDILASALAPSDPSQQAKLLELFNIRLNSCIGHAIAGKKLFIVNTSGQLCATGEEGEIYVACDYVATEYLGDAEKTARAFVNFEYAPGQFVRTYRTGDLAKQDETGALYFIGRKDQQVKLNGVRTELDDVKQKMQRALADIISDTTLMLINERLIAFVITPNMESFNNQRTLHIKALRQAGLRDEQIPILMPLARFPTLSNGKIDNNALRQLYLNHCEITLSSTDTTESRIGKLLLGITGNAAFANINLNQSIDLAFKTHGIDSLTQARVQLALIKEFGQGVNLFAVRNLTWAHLITQLGFSQTLAVSTDSSSNGDSSPAPRSPLLAPSRPRSPYTCSAFARANGADSDSDSLGADSPLPSGARRQASSRNKSPYLSSAFGGHQPSSLKHSTFKL